MEAELEEATVTICLKWHPNPHGSYVETLPIGWTIEFHRKCILPPSYSHDRESGWEIVEEKQRVSPLGGLHRHYTSGASSIVFFALRGNRLQQMVQSAYISWLLLGGEHKSSRAPVILQLTCCLKCAYEAALRVGQELEQQTKRNHVETDSVRCRYPTAIIMAN